VRILPKEIKKQRDNNVTVWLGREYRDKIRKEAFKMGVSITFILNRIIGEYYKKEKK